MAYVPPATPTMATSWMAHIVGHVTPLARLATLEMLVWLVKFSQTIFHSTTALVQIAVGVILFRTVSATSAPLLVSPAQPLQTTVWRARQEGCSIRQTLPAQTPAVMLTLPKMWCPGFSAASAITVARSAQEQQPTARLVIQPKDCTSTCLEALVYHAMD